MFYSEEYVMERQLYEEIIANGNYGIKKYSKGQIIFFQDDNVFQSCVIKSGKVRVYTQNEKNDIMTLFQCSEHYQCPISTLSILSGQKAIATAEAVEDTEVFVLSKASIERMFRTNQAYQTYLFENISMVTEMIKNLLEESSFLSTKERLLCFLSRQDSTTISLTHNVISSELGTHRVVVSKVLKELEKEGYLELQRGKIILREIQK